MNETGRIRLSNNANIPGPMDFDYEILDGSTPIPPTPPTDSIDLNTVTIYNSPLDMASWPETVKIVGIDMNPASGFAFRSNVPVPDSWKWYTGNGSDNYQYTVWPVIKFNGIWYSSGIVQMWQDRISTGAFEFPTWHDDFHKNWCYDARWGNMFYYYPNPGEQFGFFVSAGNARGVDGVTSVRERSNVVTIILPVGDVGSFNF